mmetsp:Transcript_30809/g.98374  ORF Transcript_30809/g.98374 Transcript_30809/m.98374 type:complete len:293 (-) Transcript_30809:35-913(-)
MRRHAGALAALLAVHLLAAPPGACADSAPPFFRGGYPSVDQASNTGGGELSLQVMLNEPGAAHYLAAPAFSPRPTPAQVRSGGSYGGVAPATSGSIKVPAGGTEYSAALTGLTEGREYDIYVAAEDAYGNLQAAATLVIAIPADATPPAFGAGYPLLSNITGNGFTIETPHVERGTVHYVVLPGGSPSPAPTDVLAGAGAGGAPGSAVACGSYPAPGAHRVESRGSEDPACSTRVAFYGLEAGGAGAAGLGAAAGCQVCVQLEADTSYQVFLLAEDDEGAQVTLIEVLGLRV